MAAQHGSRDICIENDMNMQNSQSFPHDYNYAIVVVVAAAIDFQGVKVNLNDLLCGFNK